MCFDERSSSATPSEIISKCQTPSGLTENAGHEIAVHEIDGPSDRA